MRIIEPSELIINQDGSIFHLHLTPDQIAEDIILVGDPGRVDTVSSYFSKKEFSISNREFKSSTGYFNNKRITVVSTGIGTDNIDIVVNELDALANIDLKKRIIKEKFKKLNLIRLGTSGAMQPEIPLGSFLLTEISIGFDGLLNFYADRSRICDLEMEKAFLHHTGWNPLCAKPYFTRSSDSLINLFASFTIKGVTISAPGFYGPQGRVLRLPLADPELNNKIESFRYNGYKITNFEMESSAINGLSKLLGHSSATICVIIANRVVKDATKDYSPSIKQLIELTLQKIAE